MNIYPNRSRIYCKQSYYYCIRELTIYVADSGPALLWWRRAGHICWYSQGRFARPATKPGRQPAINAEGDNLSDHAKAGLGGLSAGARHALKLPGGCDHCPLRSLTVYGGDPAEDGSRIEALRLRCTTFAARRAICYEGDAPTELFQLFDGWAFRYKVTRDGRRQILSFILPGDLIDLPLLGSERIAHAVKALTAISVCVFSRTELADFIYGNAERARRAGAAFAAQSAATDEQMLDLGQRSAFERIARLLNHLAVQLRRRGLAEAGGFRLPLTQSHIADATGLTAVHVGRTLREMRKSKLLSLAQGWLTIEDPESLAAI